MPIIFFSSVTRILHRLLGSSDGRTAPAGRHTPSSSPLPGSPEFTNLRPAGGAAGPRPSSSPGAGRRRWLERIGDSLIGDLIGGAALAVTLVSLLFIGWGVQ